MKRRNDYKIRAFELGQEGKVNEAPQQVSTGAKKETPFPRASGPASHRPAWRVEVVEELPKKKRVRRGRPPLPKEPQKPKQKGECKIKCVSSLRDSLCTLFLCKSAVD